MSASVSPDIIGVIVRIRDANPDLTPSGYLVRYERRPLTYDAEMALRRKHSAARAQMTAPWFVAEVEAAMGFFRSADAPRTIRRHYTSYGLKHSVERALGRYVSNGAVIVAAVALELDVQRIAEMPNARIRMPRRRAA